MIEVPKPSSKEFAAEERKKANISRKLGESIVSSKQYAELSAPLKQIVTEIAVNALMLNDNQLVLKAWELDALALSSTFSQVERAINGDLASNFSILINQLRKDGRYSTEEARRFAGKSLRESVVAREARTRLAEALGYKPGGLRSSRVKGGFWQCK
jgi:hypothetical protein